MSEPKKPIANIAPFGLRMQPELKQRVEEAAQQSGRSMNAEIVDRLEASFSSWPHINLLPEIRYLSGTYSEQVRASYEKELNTYANQLAESYFPGHDFALVRIMRVLDTFISLATPDRRDELRNEAKTLIHKLIDEMPEQYWRNGDNDADATDQTEPSKAK